MMNEIAIKVNNISKIYKLYNKPIDRLKEALCPLNKKYHKDFYALKDISFEIRKGETVGILGRNGAGKSTLLKIITGVLTQSNGEVFVNGKIASLLELGAGFNPEMTGLENVYLQGTLMGFSKEEVSKKLNEILEFADIGDFIYQTVKTYSSGMFARLAFSIAINVEPEILIIDEVLSVGDKKFQKKCVDKIDELRKRGITILIVSHDEYTIRNTCNKALYLKNGLKVCYESSSDAISIYSFDIEEKEEKKQVVINKQENFYFDIEKVVLLNHKNENISTIKSGNDIKIKFNFKCIGEYKSKLSFVVNLYTKNDIYIYGTTTLMKGLKPFSLEENIGEVEITFPKLNLLQGYYKFRVAINDETGMMIFSEATPVCEFKVEDVFEAVGLINLDTKWEIYCGKNGK